MITTPKCTRTRECECGETIHFYGFDTACECGREYNAFGQRLAPRSQWDEDGFYGMNEGEEYRAPDKNDSSDDDLFCCPQCGEHVKYEYEPPYQEYAGGKVWGGEHTANCPCGWEDTRKGDLANYNVRENTRSW